MIDIFSRQLIVTPNTIIDGVDVGQINLFEFGEPDKRGKCTGHTVDGDSLRVLDENEFYYLVKVILDKRGLCYNNPATGWANKQFFNVLTESGAKDNI